MSRHGPDDDSVAQYVAGAMDATELEGFEQHLLECESCRNAVRVGATARVALVGSAGSQVSRGVPGRTRIFWLAAAAGITTIILVNQNDSIGRLGEITAAPFVAGAVRPASDSITTLVDSGMAAYVAADFRTAARQLERAASGDSSASVSFFLGVSLLMNEENRAALRALESVTAGTAYGTEAAYYRAKAFVRLQQRDSAVAVLERAMTVMTSPQLNAFADSIRRK